MTFGCAGSDPSWLVERSSDRSCAERPRLGHWHRARGPHAAHDEASRAASPRCQSEAGRPPSFPLCAPSRRRGRQGPAPHGRGRGRDPLGSGSASRRDATNLCGRSHEAIGGWREPLHRRRGRAVVISRLMGRLMEIGTEIEHATIMRQRRCLDNGHRCPSAALKRKKRRSAPRPPTCSVWRQGGVGVQAHLLLDVELRGQGNLDVDVLLLWRCRRAGVAVELFEPR